MHLDKKGPSTSTCEEFSNFGGEKYRIIIRKKKKLQEKPSRLESAEQKKRGFYMRAQEQRGNTVLRSIREAIEKRNPQTRPDLKARTHDGKQSLSKKPRWFTSYHLSSNSRRKAGGGRKKSLSEIPCRKYKLDKMGITGRPREYHLI